MWHHLLVNARLFRLNLALASHNIILLLVTVVIEMCVLDKLLESVTAHNIATCRKLKFF